MTYAIDIDFERQSLARPLTGAEEALATALETLFAQNFHDFAVVATELQVLGVARPSGEEGDWDETVLAREISLINASLDQAYDEFGVYRVRKPDPSERELSNKYQSYLAGLSRN